MQQSRLISKSDNVIEVKTFPLSNGQVTYMPYVRSSMTARRDIDAGCSELGTASTIHDLDDWGNVNKSVVTSQGGADTFVSTTDTQYRNDGTRWLVALPTHRTVTSSTSAPQASAVRTMDYDYDTETGLPTQETVEKGSSQYEVVTDSTRTGNAFGLVSKKTQRWTDPQTGTVRTRTCPK